jgi:hypothetical protein
MFFWLANLVAAAHGTLVVCVVAGSLAAMAGALRRHHRLEMAFYALLAAVIASEVLFGECFLTGLEQFLRNADRPGSAYRGSFLGYYCPLLPPIVQTHAGPALIAGALLAFSFWRRLDRRRK